MAQFPSIAEGKFQRCFESLEIRWNKQVEYERGYFEENQPFIDFYMYIYI